MFILFTLRLSESTRVRLEERSLSQSDLLVLFAQPFAHRRKSIALACRQYLNARRKSVELACRQDLIFRSLHCE
jgi:hypothetical protein